MGLGKELGRCSVMGRRRCRAGIIRDNGGFPNFGEVVDGMWKVSLVWKASLHQMGKDQCRSSCLVCHWRRCGQIWLGDAQNPAGPLSMANGSG